MELRFATIDTSEYPTKKPIEFIMNLSLQTLGLSTFELNDKKFFMTITFELNDKKFLMTII